MKTIVIFISTFLCTNIVFSQQNPTGTAGNSSDWHRGGNLVAPPGQGGSNNIFGTMWDSPIYTYTSGLPRTKLNGNLTTTVNGVAKSFAGFFGISPSGYFNSSINTPWSMLHLDGPNNVTQFGGGGWRQWMNTGTFMRENSDAMYVGLMEVGTNRSDAIINWSDDVNLNPGPDKLRFIFTGANTGNGNGQTDPRDPYALNGYEFMRMTTQGPVNGLNNASGHIGIGPLFTDANFPRSRVHMHSEDNLTNYIQVSIDASTGIAATDGTRMGVLGAQSSDNREGNALLYNQENKHLLFSTGFATPGNIDVSRERVRITQIGAETNLANGGYGVNNPWSNPITRLTRMSVSRDPFAPVVRPMATFHVGHGYSTANNFGWRNWMDQGMLVVNNAENHMYFGFKPEAANLPNQDAVVSWGKNQASPERLRFIYSSTVGTSAGGDGLEITRMWSDGNEGRMGVGDFFNLGIEPQNTLHINSTALNDQTVGGSSGLRLHDLTSNSPILAANPGLGVLSVDANGDVIYVPGGGTGIGNYCSNPVQNPLTDHYEIPMNNFNYFFSGTGLPNASSVAIGVPCGTFLPAKFNVYQNAGITVGTNTFGSAILNQDIANASFLIIRGSYSESNGIQTLTKTTNLGGEFRASNADINIGVRSRVLNTISNIAASSTSGDFLTNGPSGSNQGIIAQASNATGNNTGVQGLAFSNNSISNRNTGGYFNASGNTNYSYGVFAESFGGAIINRAGYFNGDLEYTGSLIVPSDQNLKSNIVSLGEMDSLLNLLDPKTFEYNTTLYPQMNFSSGTQMGLIAQEVEQILPQLVKQGYKPAVIDSNGIEIYPSISYKNLNYEGFIPVLIAGHKDQSKLIEEQDSLITSLQEQINTLYSMITSCCNNNSNTQNNSIQQNPNTTLDVTLSDNVPSIVLNQNVPNPFAEQTTITYTLTEGVKKAQMLFYNIEGKLIQAVELSNASGQGQMNVFANDLSTGVYTYTLVVDGEIKGTKRMVKE